MFTTLFVLAALGGGGYGIYKWRQKENAKQAALDEEFKKLEEEIINNPVKPSEFNSGSFTPRKTADPSPWKRAPAPYVAPKPVEKKREESRSSDSGVGDFLTGAIIGAAVSSWTSSDSSSSSSSSSSDSGWSSGGDSGGGGSSSDF